MRFLCLFNMSLGFQRLGNNNLAKNHISAPEVPFHPGKLQSQQNLRTPGSWSGGDGVLLFTLDVKSLGRHRKPHYIAAFSFLSPSPGPSTQVSASVLTAPLHTQGFAPSLQLSLGQSYSRHPYHLSLLFSSQIQATEYSILPTTLISIDFSRYT